MGRSRPRARRERVPRRGIIRRRARGTRAGARRAVSKAVTYDRKTLFELRDANARVTSELPVELATSALEIVKKS